MKKVRVVLSPDAQAVYEHLVEMAPKSKLERSILNAISRKVELIKANVHYGSSIPKDRIPMEYVAKYGVTNLFHVELPNFWRMIYTLTNGGTEIEIVAFVLDIMEHPAYSRKFGYKKGQACLLSL